MLRVRFNARWVSILVSAFFALLASGPAWAITTGQVRITTIDEETLVPLSGVEVSLRGANLIGGAQVRLTKADGTAEYTQLPPGSYEVSAVREGFRSVTVSDLKVNLNQTTTYTIEMRYGELEEIEVVAKEKAVDTESTTRKTVLSRDFLSKIPAGRSFQQAIQTSVGVNPGSGGNANIAGGASNENTYLLDGVNFTDPVTGTFSANFNFDAIEQIEVLLGGYMPEYGTSAGGIVNLVTQSGTNNFEFDTVITASTEDLSGRYDERLSADGVELAPSDFDIKQRAYSVSSRVSGPLVRDKAWFIVSYRNVRNISSFLGIRQARDFNQNSILTRLTVQPSTEHRLSALLIADPTTIDNQNQFNPFLADEAQSTFRQGGFGTSFRWQWFLSPELTLDTTLFVQNQFLESTGVPCTHDRSVNINPCEPFEREGTIDFDTPGRQGFGGALDSGNTAVSSFLDRGRYQASTRLSWVGVQDPWGGKHDFKVGAEGVQTVSDAIVGFNGNTFYTDLNFITANPTTFDNFQVSEFSDPFQIRQTGSTLSLFIQDSWKPVSNLTINYGTRFDTFVLRNDLGDAVVADSLLGPRLFGAWDPWGDQKTKIATGFGRFNDTGRLAVAGYTSQSGFGQKTYDGAVFGEFVTSPASSRFTVDRENFNTVASDLRTPRVDELILTLEREIVDDVAFTSNLSARFTRFGYEPDEVNFIYDSDGSALIGSRVDDIDNSYGRLRTPVLAKRDFLTWDVGFRKVQSRRWQGSVTYSYTYEQGSSPFALSGSFLVDPQVPFNYGNTNNGNRHVVRASGFWDLPTDPWTQSIGAFFFWSDGRALDRTYIVDDPQGGVTRPLTYRIDPRGTYDRFNPFWRLDLSFQQTIDVRKGELVAGVQVQNVLAARNPVFATNVLFRDNRYGTALRNQPLGLLAILRYRF